MFFASGGSPTFGDWASAGIATNAMARPPTNVMHRCMKFLPWPLLGFFEMAIGKHSISRQDSKAAAARNPWNGNGSSE